MKAYHQVSLVTRYDKVLEIMYNFGITSSTLLRKDNTSKDNDNRKRSICDYDNSEKNIEANNDCNDDNNQCQWYKFKQS